MKVYIAGKFDDKEKIRKYMDQVENLGHKITHDWTNFEVKNDPDNLLGGDGENMSESAKYDINGVKECDVMIVVMEDKDYPYRGTFTELGCALGLEKTIVIWCPNPKASCRTNCFFYHPSILHVDHWEQVLEVFDTIDMFS